MLLRDVMPHVRHAIYCALPAVLVFSISTNQAFAQASDEFASSSSGLAVSSDSNFVTPVAPATTAVSQSDGSYQTNRHRTVDRLTFEGGGGFNAPSGNSSDYITWGGNFTGGVGYRVVPHVSVMAEYQFIADKLPGRLIAETGASGGYAHIWSLTLDPVIDLFPKRINDVYVTGGGGFYRKVTSFTDPQEVEYCDYFYCGIDVENQVVGHFSSNQGGWNVGAGFTHKLGGTDGDNKAKLFAEARYLEVMTPSVVSQPNGLGTTTVAADTKLIPITLGVRW